MEGILTAWGKILRGYRPSLSIEITRECPLRCPGCYAYGDDHLGGDVTRTPATYDRIVKHIKGHQITVHCTVTRQQVQRNGYLEEFTRLWSQNPDTKQIWFSLYTPQIGEASDEILTPHDRERVIAALMALRGRYPK